MICPSLYPGMLQPYKLSSYLHSNFKFFILLLADVNEIKKNEKKKLKSKNRKYSIEKKNK